MVDGISNSQNPQGTLNNDGVSLELRSYKLDKLELKYNKAVEQRKQSGEILGTGETSRREKRLSKRIAREKGKLSRLVKKIETLANK